MPTELETSDDLCSTLDRIIQDLDDDADGLPRDAIREARKHRDQIIPRLIQSIRDATAAAATGHAPEGNAHFYALFLLAEFKATEALPAVVEAISLPGELPFDLFGDAITESLSAILAALAVDRPEVLDELIGNRSINEYVRWAAADTFLYWVRDGRITREYAVERLGGLLREAVARSDSQIVNGLVNALTDFCPREALDEIREAFERGLVDETLITFEEVEESVAESESRFQARLDRCRPSGVQDTIAELDSWASFETAEPRLVEAFGEPRELDLPQDDYDEPPTTIRNIEPRVGRNDPCPCGSGKKFKKCCGRR
jgi:hypothetical protein